MPMSFSWGGGRGRAAEAAGSGLQEGEAGGDGEVVAVAAAVEFLADEGGDGGAFAAAAGFGHEGGLEDPEGVVVVVDAGAVEEGAGGDDLVVHAPVGAAAEGVEVGAGPGRIWRRRGCRGYGAVSGARGVGDDIEDGADGAAGGFVVEIAEDEDMGGGIAGEEVVDGAGEDFGGGEAVGVGFGGAGAARGPVVDEDMQELAAGVLEGGLEDVAGFAAPFQADGVGMEWRRVKRSWL
jgi:hypothetical protein